MKQKTIKQNNLELDLGKENIEELFVKGNNNIIKNLQMNLSNKKLKVNGCNNIFINAKFSGLDEEGDYIIIKGQHTRFSNCLFENFKHKGHVLSINLIKSKPSYSLIENCNFRDIKSDIIKIGNNKSNVYESKCMIYNNFFSNCEGMILKCNSSNNVFIYNKIFDNGIINIFGNNNLIEENIFNSSLGLVVNNNDNKIVNNTFDNIEDEVILINNTNNLLIEDNKFLGCRYCFIIYGNTENLRMLNNKLVKCVGEFNDIDGDKPNGTYFTSNLIIEKDINIPIYKSIDLEDDIKIDELHFNLTNKTIINDCDDNEEKVDLVIIDEDDKPKKKKNNMLMDLLERIEELKMIEKDKSLCRNCDDLLKNMNMIKKKYDKEVKDLKEELKEKEEFIDMLKELLKE